MDTTTLRQLADEPGRGDQQLVDRLDRTLRRRSRLRAVGGGLVLMLAMTVAVEVLPMNGSRPDPTVVDTIAGPADEPDCPPTTGRVRRLASGALAAAALAGCTSGGIDGPDGRELTQGAVLEVTGDDTIAGTYIYPQISEQGLVDGVAVGPQRDQEGYQVSIEFLDDDFDFVRITGQVTNDGQPYLVPAFRIDGRRFANPACELTTEALPPGRTAGTFTCTDVTDGRGETTVTIHGSFNVPDLQQLTPP